MKAVAVYIIWPCSRAKIVLLKRKITRIGSIAIIRWLRVTGWSPFLFVWFLVVICCLGFFVWPVLICQFSHMMGFFSEWKIQYLWTLSCFSRHLTLSLKMLVSVHRTSTVGDPDLHSFRKAVCSGTIFPQCLRQSLSSLAMTICLLPIIFP